MIRLLANKLILTILTLSRYAGSLRHSIFNQPTPPCAICMTPGVCRSLRGGRGAQRRDLHLRRRQLQPGLLRGGRRPGEAEAQAEAATQPDLLHQRPD